MKLISDGDFQEKRKMFPIKYTKTSNFVYIIFQTKIYLNAFSVVQWVLISFRLIYGLFICYFPNKKKN